MQEVSVAALQKDFARYEEAGRAAHRRSDLGFQWWLTGVANLGEVAPIVASQYRLDRAACIMAVRKQFTGGDLNAIEFLSALESQGVPEPIRNVLAVLHDDSVSYHAARKAKPILKRRRK